MSEEMKRTPPRPEMDEQVEREVAEALGGHSVEEMMEEQSAPIAAREPGPDAPDATGETAAGEAERSPAPPAPPDDAKRRTGTVAAVQREHVFVELGGKDQGLCERSLFAGKPPRVGERIEFIVERFLDSEGLYKLALPGATTKADWETLARGMVVEAMVTGMNTGGLELKVAGKKAFMPVSQIDRDRVEEKTPYLNKKLRCKVMELDKRKRRVVLSRRAVQDEEAEHQRRELLQEIEVGQVREGTVRKVQPFGAFVEIAPGIDGLVHVSDMSYARVKHPGDVVQKGQVVEVEVLKVSGNGERIGLGMKQTQTDPWEGVGQRYPVGAEVAGTVTRTTEFGAFVELEPGVEGLIHISQLSAGRVQRVGQVAKEGERITSRVVSFDPGRRRIGLSVKAMTADEKPSNAPSREDMHHYVRRDEKEAHAMSSLMNKFGGGGGLKGGIG